MNLGVIVEVQAAGGNYLSLGVNHGRLKFLGTPTGSSVTGACVPLATDTVVMELIPDQQEAVLYASLYDFDKAPDSGVTGPCVTSAMPIASAAVPISHPPDNEGDEDDAGPADAGDAGPTFSGDAGTDAGTHTDAGTTTDAGTDGGAP